LKNRQLKEFREALLAWFGEFRRDLPWRRTQDPYRIWVSEIMLQQTRVAAVIPYYEKFLTRFPEIAALAEAPQEEVLRFWSGLGYYSRARNLQRAAQKIMSIHGGEFPRDRDQVLELAGIGEYTAAAILSIAFGEKLAVLDGNVARVLARLDAVRGDLREPARWKALQARANELLDAAGPGDWNQAMMELGATLCTPRLPQCLLCPVQKFCEARRLGIAESVPQKRSKREAVSVHLVSLVLIDERGRSLLLPPPEVSGKSHDDEHVPSLVAKLWHFPTAAVASNEPGVRVLLQSVFGRTRLAAIKSQILPPVRHTVTYRNIRITPYIVIVKKLPEVRGAHVAPLEQLMNEPISNLTRKVAKAALAARSEQTVSTGN
jgi:A/G-specific adenine glycosylase